MDWAQYYLIQRSPQLELDYFLCLLMKNLSTKDIVKLTNAPTDANNTVRKTSSECKFGNTQKNDSQRYPSMYDYLPALLFSLRCRQ